MSEIDSYLQKHASSEQAKILNKIRATIHQIIPEVEETLSYGIPTFKYKGKYVAYIAAFKNHMSIYPAIQLEGELDKKLDKFRAGKGTLRFTEKEQIPAPLLRAFIKARFEARKKSMDRY